jgi:hypothetical protein
MSEYRDLHSADGRADATNAQLGGHTGGSLDAHSAHERNRIRSGLAAPSLLWELSYIATWP